MKQLQIKAIPNQSLSVSLDGSLYAITIKETNGVMAVTIVRDGVTLIQNHRAVSGGFLIPYKYLENGNFVFITQNYEYPYYDGFGVSQYLFYVSQSELETIRLNRPRFNPIAKEPLRYRPEGYDYVYLATEDGDVLATEQGDSFILGGSY